MGDQVLINWEFEESKAELINDPFVSLYNLQKQLETLQRTCIYKTDTLKGEMSQYYFMHIYIYDPLQKSLSLSLSVSVFWWWVRKIEVVEGKVSLQPRNQSLAIGFRFSSFWWPRPTNQINYDTLN
ncbi:hypothetical protein O6P43_021581 [Quillaja saponaria]|uniref:Uncharacterized protein n=1 Tax=Quillaja saponaria TaxID=32244 RepID=A0AAD7PHB8_QUISA|nr:hypothetical protein O6P43_021581 [Quillaja saponaria]